MSNVSTVIDKRGSSDQTFTVESHIPYGWWKGSFRGFGDILLLRHAGGITAYPENTSPLNVMPYTSAERQIPAKLTPVNVELVVTNEGA